MSIILIGKIIESLINQNRNDLIIHVEIMDHVPIVETIGFFLLRKECHLIMTK